MTRKKLLVAVRIISKIIGMICLITGIVYFMIGFICSLFMGPIDSQQADNVMMIGIAALALLFQNIPYLTMLIGGCVIICGVINLIISRIIDNYIDYELEVQKRKTYQLIISIILYAIISLPSIIFMFAFVVTGEDFLTTLYFVCFWFSLGLPYYIMIIFLFMVRKFIINYNIEDNNIVDNIILDTNN